MPSQSAHLIDIRRDIAVTCICRYSINCRVPSHIRGSVHKFRNLVITRVKIQEAWRWLQSQSKEFYFARIQKLLNWWEIWDDYVEKLKTIMSLSSWASFLSNTLSGTQTNNGAKSVLYAGCSSNCRPNWWILFTVLTAVCGPGNVL